MTARADLALALQYALPHRLLTTLARWLSRWRWAPFKNTLIRLVVRRFEVDMSEAELSDPEDYESFDAFFTRALKPGLRRFDASDSAILSPCDGAVSEAGQIEAGRLLQAKGISYPLVDLLADEHAAAALQGGRFMTLYLSPRDYHRVHMPFSGRLRSSLHIPGRLFSVAPAAVEGVPGLFTRNERLVGLFDTEHGPAVVVMVGAMLVSGIETPWGGWFVPPYASRIQRQDYAAPLALARGSEFGRFHYGSTVIVITPAGAPAWRPGLVNGRRVRVGEVLAD
jgi:phosphatidylserine decarboxylase